jgi:hypothetical protein
LLLTSVPHCICISATRTCFPVTADFPIPELPECILAIEDLPKLTPKRPARQLIYGLSRPHSIPPGQNKPCTMPEANTATH